MSHHTHLEYDLDRVHSVTNLPQGQCLISKSRNYYARVQADGNFVVYVSGHFTSKNAIWSSNTYGKGVAPYHLRMQDDGNLVLYDGQCQPLWASDTWNKGKGPWTAIMQDDGNLIVQDSHKHVTWASNTSR